MSGHCTNSGKGIRLESSEHYLVRPRLVKIEEMIAGSEDHETLTFASLCVYHANGTKSQPKEQEIVTITAKECRQRLDFFYTSNWFAPILDSAIVLLLARGHDHTFMEGSLTERFIDFIRMDIKEYEELLSIDNQIDPIDVLKMRAATMEIIADVWHDKKKEEENKS